MSPLAIIVLAFSMSADSFAVSVGRGIALGRPPAAEILRTGVVFGVVEALTPVMGWSAGFAASNAVAAVDHWIVFALLVGVGANMLYGAIRKCEHDSSAGQSLCLLIAAAVSTSLDAMAVGVSLAFLNVSIASVALSIGATTFLLSSGGMLVGRFVGERCGRAAEIVAGAALCGLGTLILIEHLR